MDDKLENDNFKKNYCEGVTTYFESLSKLAQSQLDSGLVLQTMISSQISELSIHLLPKYAKHIESMQRLSIKLIHESKENFETCYAIDEVLKGLQGEQLELPLN